MNKYNAESTIAILVAIMIFALLSLIYINWQSYQNNQQSMLFQKQQALQIAENQIARQMAKLPCEHQMTQNSLVFHIKCQADKIHVRFPKGEIWIEKAVE